MPRSTLVASPEVIVDGSPVPTSDLAQISELHVSRTLGAPSELTLCLIDETFELLDGSRYVVGATIEVKFPDPTGKATSVFKGEVVSVGVDQHAGQARGCLLTLTALDLAHRLGHQTRVRTFQKQKYSDVVSRIASEYGLQSQVDDTSISFDYLIQTTTDYAFLQELAFRTGYEWRVDDSKLIFKPRADSSPVVTVRYGEDVRRIRARYTAGNEVAGVTVRAWNPLSKTAAVGTSQLSSVRGAGASGSASELVTQGRNKARAFSKDVASSSLLAAVPDEATQLANALATRLATADLSVRCECLGDPRIAAGSVVKIENAGTKLSGNYYVTSVEHHFGRDGDLTTTFSTAPSDSSSIVDLLGGAERVNPFGQLGLTIGVVTNNKDPDGHGRVRVKFPALSDSEESWWARIVTPGGGSEAGLMFMPQVDDEVLIGFEHGDMRRPYVLGGLWGAKAKPPTATDTFLANNKVIEWGVKTANKTTLTIRGGDKPEDKHYKFALPDGTTHYMGSDKTEIIAQNKSIELKSGQASIKITDQGDIEIKGNNIKIEATQNLTVDGLQIAAKAKTSLKAEGSASLELKGGASAKLEASGITEIKGSLVKIQ
ncbi:MAG TPA: VgrG-related protein [Ilumatobacter sp.]|nr:VgrG-related protein [Ilumatobacter sp.]